MPPYAVLFAIFIEARTPYKVCDAVDNGVSAIHKGMEARCDLIPLNLSMPRQDSLVTVSPLRSKVPHVKIVGFNASLLMDLEVSPATGFDAVLTPHLDRGAAIER